MQNPEIKLSVPLKNCREKAQLFKGPGAASDFCDFLNSLFEIYKLADRFADEVDIDDFELFEGCWPIVHNSYEWNLQVLPAHDRMDNAAIIAVHFVGKGTFYI